MIWGHSLVGIQDGNLLMLGGVGPNVLDDIWLLKNNEWSLVGHLKNVRKIHFIYYQFPKRDSCHSSISIGSSVYLFSGEFGENANERIDLVGDEVINVEQIGAHTYDNCNPVIFQTDANFCVNE